MTTLLRTITPSQLPKTRTDAQDDASLNHVRAILDDVRERGEAAVRLWSERFGDLQPGDPLTYTPEALAEALGRIDQKDREMLLRVAGRIRRFADAQRAALHDCDIAVPGGRAGHRFAPIERAGCYAPGGRYPLPSSVLMTAITARAAGVERVIVASPRPTPITLAAAAIAGADMLLALGGVQAIAALAYGFGDIAPCDVVVGPGNRWVTAAKQLVAGRVGIDLLAGPSELVIIADEFAAASTIAADLLAQAEHDADALPILVTSSVGLIDEVNRELHLQLADLPTAPVAKASLENGFAVCVDSLQHAAAVANELAPEHLELLISDPAALLPHLKHFGTVFLGEKSAEVFGDYGVGPNHTLPTSGTARWTAGLSVLIFLRAQTWVHLNSVPAELAADAARLARLEGLEGHARAVVSRTSRL